MVSNSFFLHISSPPKLIVHVCMSCGLLCFFSVQKSISYRMTRNGTCWKMWEAIMASMSIVEQMLVVCYNIAWYFEIETSVYVIGLEPIFQTLVHGCRTRTNFLKHEWNLILRLPQTPWHSGRKEEQFV
jgi:hypothetical protein